MKKILYFVVVLAVMVLTACGIEKAEAALSHCTRSASGDNDLMNKIGNTGKKQIEVSSDNTFGIISWKNDVDNILGVLSNISYKNVEKEISDSSSVYNIKVIDGDYCVWSAIFAYDEKSDSHIYVESGEYLFNYEMTNSDADKLYNQLNNCLEKQYE